MLIVESGGCVGAMADEPFALSTIAPAWPAKADYDALCAAVQQTMRGRWFLEEYARRNRNADTAVLLAAIERIEAVIRGGQAQAANLGLRIELLEMAKAIAQTRAEVAEIGPDGPPPGTPAEPKAEAPRDVFAAAERLQDVAWTLRERGLDPGTCDQIEALATTILSATSLRDPNSARAQKLGDVLAYLEWRIEAMLDANAESAKTLSEHAPGMTSGSQPLYAGNGHDPDAAHAITAERPDLTTSELPSSGVEGGQIGGTEPAPPAVPVERWSGYDAHAHLPR